ncbi:hypothetical protein MF408_11910 [Nocardioides sp. TF02-7]|nr:hypothetical protein [Nocardioides sp. TF02-7]UMG94587.1 hypothetical protein MF408_11910 [Nocardioides sp. TF02-7]
MAATKERPPGLDSPVTARVIKYGARLHVPVFRLTNGRIGSRWRIGAGWRKPVPTLLLDHVRTAQRQAVHHAAALPPRRRPAGGRRVPGRTPPPPAVVPQPRGAPRHDGRAARRAVASGPGAGRGPGGARRAVAAARGAVRRLRELPGLDRPGDPGRRPRPPRLTAGKKPAGRRHG